jgi:alkaline phosphatase
MTGRESFTGSANIQRRAFLKDGVLMLSALGSVGASTCFADDHRVIKPSTLDQPRNKVGTSPVVRVGMVTDLHHAEKDAAGNRFYRETLGKLEEAAGYYQNNRIDLMVELGDIIDAADSVETERRYLSTINRPFSAIATDRHYVLGNHCVDTLTKEEFLAGVERERSYYSFDREGIHFVVLDSCFRSDGVAYGRRNFQWTDPNIPPEELEWLRGDLQSNKNPVIVFAHQRLDVADSHGVKNAKEVRSILESVGNVTAVFQGHSHKNDLRSIEGIFYCTLVAMIEGSGKENSGYSMMEVRRDGSIALKGFRKQSDREFTKDS